MTGVRDMRLKLLSIALSFYQVERLLLLRGILISQHAQMFLMKRLVSIAQKTCPPSSKGATIRSVDL